MKTRYVYGTQADKGAENSTDSISDDDDASHGTSNLTHLRRVELYEVGERGVAGRRAGVWKKLETN